MQPITIKHSTRRRVFIALYALYCWASSAIFMWMSETTDILSFVCRGMAVVFAVWGLVVLWLLFASVTVGPDGIGQRWPGVRQTIPWAKVESITVVQRGNLKRRRQVQVTLTGGRKFCLAVPVDGLTKHTNPAFDQEVAAIQDYWESVQTPVSPSH